MRAGWGGDGNDVGLQIGQSLRPVQARLGNFEPLGKRLNCLCCSAAEGYHVHAGCAQRQCVPFARPT